MPCLELTLFERFGARLKGGPVIELPTKKIRLLLAYLALTPGQAHPRERIAALLWSDRGDEQAHDSLRHALSVLRKALRDADPQPLVADRETVSLDPAAVEVDVVAFDTLVAAGTREALEQASALYRGELLEGVSVRDPPFEEWLFYERQRLRDLALRAFEQLLVFEQEAGESDKAIETAQRLLKFDPAHEKTHRELMGLYADQGRGAAALEQYQHCRATLKRELEVEPGAETEALYREILERKEKPPERAQSPAAALKPMPRRWVAIGGGGLLLIAAIAVGVWQLYPTSTEQTTGERPVLELPDKPSIAVLPFKNLSGDPEQEYFVDGMTDDLITDLSKVSGLFVIASNSVFTYKGKEVKVQQVARELGVQYVLEGSVRRADDQVRINAQLIDATTGGHLWAERYDGSLADVFALQDKVTQKIVTALAVKLTSAESAEVAEAGTDVPQAYDAFLQGREYFRRRTTEDIDKAISYFEKAIQLDSGYSQAYAGLATAYWYGITLSWQFAGGIGWQRTYDGAMENLAKALEKPTSDAYAVSAEILTQQGRHEEALAQLDRAIALGPNNPDVHISKARVLNAIGRAQEAEKSARLAMRLNPHYPADYLRALGRALFHQERYEEAAETLERVVSRQPDVFSDYTTLSATYGHLGRIVDAGAAIEKYNEILSRIDYTPMSVQEVGIWWYGDIYDYDETYRERLIKGVQKAGVPEGAEAQARSAAYKALMSKSGAEYDVEGATEIDAATAKALSDRGVVIVDVRDAGSFGREHIPGAAHLDLNIGLSEESLSQLIGKDDEVVFHCWGKYCPYSAYASAKALTWDFTRVYYFAGGLPAWKDAGYPTELP